MMARRRGSVGKPLWAFRRGPALDRLTPKGSAVAAAVSTAAVSTAASVAAVAETAAHSLGVTGKTARALQDGPFP